MRIIKPAEDVWDASSVYDASRQQSQDVINAALAQQIGTKYEKPAGGIPKTDLAQSVQNSLNSADEVPDLKSAVNEIAETHIYYENLFDENMFVSGVINADGENTTNSNFVRTKGSVEIQPTHIITNYYCFIVFYDENQNFISPRVEITNTNLSSGVDVPATAKYVRFSIKKTIFNAHTDDFLIINGSTLPDAQTPEEVQYIAIATNTRKKIFGRNFLIYKFGGDGNDWCFVRTPSDYDPFRSKPYPFVICNHGNGTVMDGSGYTATWTPRTMYLDPENSHFSAAYDMIATTDPELQYSNPTIEKFLANGYIVCGCENYGDSLFGNDNCRKACVAFYEHMIRTYNVHDWCYMIGASNGAQTSINAAFLLREKVRAMVLQYPLTCLINEYNSVTGQRANIRSAYGITGTSPTTEELIQATLTHDVLHWEKGEYFNGYFPPVKLYYSAGDTITPPQANALALIEKLQAGYKIYESVVCTGEHGDISHFDPDGFYDFLSSH